MSNYISALYRKKEYYDIVRNTILLTVKRGLNYYDLEDCVADVWVIAIKKSKELETHTNIKGWLAKTAKYVAIRFENRKSAENRLLSYMSSKYVSGSGNWHNKLVEDMAFIELLDFLKNNLRFSEYTLLTMRFIETRTIDEIAAVIGIKPHSVEVKISRLKAKIREILQ